SGMVTITNNGVSLFPNLTLGKPAAIINVSVGKNTIFFEPELRWGINGKPWSYIYWLRYRPKKISNQFGFHLGVHPSYVIRENEVTINGMLVNRYITQRYFAGEIVPVWSPSSKFSIGLHVLQAAGLDENAVQRSLFVALQPRFQHIGLSKNYFLSYFPQFFYLELDDKNGSYFSHTLNLNKSNFPFAISSVFTYKFKSTIPGDDIVWNIGLNLKL
ncbi:MAG: hypothetical protein KA143_06540, partial [Saprospiraceae bacterium]|nr:hypothetical protein [Saprospiraceae bacterium]